MKDLSPILCAVLIAGLLFGSLCVADEGITGAVSTTPETESDSARQLRIYAEALTRGASEQSRTDAAVELLRRSDSAAWEILLKALLAEDNPQTRQAVCRGLIKTKSWGSGIRSRKPFLEPLIGMLVDKTGDDAELAAEALTVFPYDDVADRLGNLARTTSLDSKMRLNAIYALSLWPDKGAILELVNLLDDPVPEVAIAAADALPKWIPVGTDKHTILMELQRKTPDEIIKARLDGLQQRMRRLEGQRDRWKKMYINSLDREYEKSDEETKGKILVDRMASELPAIRLWAVRKVAAFAGPQPENFRETLLTLVSDEDRDIRLAVAGVLANMSALDPAQKLLAQLQVENYSDVRLAIFDALGEACFFAFSPGSKIVLDESIRAQTLEIAAGYLMSQDLQTAAKGAEVMGKLLELNGLPKENSLKYLQLLAARYVQEKGSNGPLRGVLLNVMARLCGQGGYQDAAAQAFGSFFVEGLADKDNNSVREAAALGLVSIDKAVAFRLFKENAFANDSSVLVRRMVIRLAGELGSAEEVIWLSERINANGEAEAAWEAMRQILLRQKAVEVFAWGQKLGAGEDKFGHAGELLEMAEKKAEGEKNAGVLIAVRSSLVDWYREKGDFSKVITYCEALLGTIEDPVEREGVEIKMLDAHLRKGDVDMVGQMVAGRLGVLDMGPEDGFVGVISGYFGEEDVAEASKTGVLESLSGIKGAEKRPKWAGQLAIWRRALQPKEPEVAE